jgi:two-component system, OmpR family, response regulator
MSKGRSAVERQAAARVLLVEDEPLTRGTITEALEGAGLSVTEAASGEDALRATDARPEPPPVVLVTRTEIHSGMMDGLTLAGEARRRWPGLGVVFITGQPSRLDGYVLGARDRFLPRPVASVLLMRAVRGLVGASA